MTLKFTVSPDFHVSQVASWYCLRSRLAGYLEKRVELLLQNSYDAFRASLQDDTVDLLFTGAFDALNMVKNKGFIPVVQSGVSEEVVMVVPCESSIETILDCKVGLKVAATSSQDVRLLGQVLLEPAGIKHDGIRLISCKNDVKVIDSLMKKEAEIGFFLKDHYDRLSQFVKQEIRVLVTSRTQVLRHLLLMAPQHAVVRDSLSEKLVLMSSNSSDRELLRGLGWGDGCLDMTIEEVEFMFDIMSALS